MADFVEMRRRFIMDGRVIYVKSFSSILTQREGPRVVVLPRVGGAFKNGSNGWLIRM